MLRWVSSNDDRCEDLGRVGEPNLRHSNYRLSLSRNDKDNCWNRRLRHRRRALNWHSVVGHSRSRGYAGRNRSYSFCQRHHVDLGLYWNYLEERYDHIWCEMTAGLLVLNDGGSVQIDEKFSALAFLAKGTSTQGTGVGSAPTFTYAANSPVIMVAGSTGHAACIAQIDNGDGTWTFLLNSDTTGDVMSWWLFDAYSPASVAGAGLRVWDASSKLVFDSGWKILQYQDLISGTLAAVSGAHTYTSGRTYAGCAALNPYLNLVSTTTVGLSTFYNYNGIGFKAASGGINLLDISYGSTLVSGGSNQSTVSALVADVTGL